MVEAKTLRDTAEELKLENTKLKLENDKLKRAVIRIKKDFRINSACLGGHN